MPVEFLPSGDTGLTVQFGDGIDRGLSRRILRLRTEIDRARLPGVVETVPTYRSLMIHYDPLRTSQAEIIDALTPYLEHKDDSHAVAATRWRLPVCFDETDFAPDLPHVSDWADMSPDAVINVMTSVTHFVYMLGFAPGQPYLGDLPDSLAIPRREDPVPGVAPGSIVIATGLTVIYTATNATGWHIIGRSPVPLFDLRADNPVLLTPGDNIDLYRIDRSEFDTIVARVDAGDFDIERSITA